MKNHISPKMKAKIEQEILLPKQVSENQPGWGFVTSYDATRNTARVIMSRPGSDQPGEIYNNVPCPVQLGIQGVAPEPGRPCWVVFKGGNFQYPIITHFFNYNYGEHDYGRSTRAGQVLPGFMMEM